MHCDGPTHGHVQVQDGATRTITVNNAGKYAADIRWYIAQQRVRRHFELMPPTATIAPGASQSVSVNFNAKQTLQKELRLLGSAALQCQVVEPLTGAQEAEVPVKVCGHCAGMAC